MKAIDLFAGCGGMSLGFQNAGVDVVAAFENWHTAAQCYRANFDHPIFETDLTDVTRAVEEVFPFFPDIIVGGPPCQDFSTAGKRVEADRANLTLCYAEIVTRVKPRCFVMENVARARKSATYAKARAAFKASGYGLTEIVLNASLCGVPQARKRFVCFGVLGAPDCFATDLFLARQTRKPTTIRDYYGDSWGIEFYYRHPRTYSRRGIYSIDEPAPTMRGVNRQLPPGYVGHPGDACPVSAGVRALTTAERAAIQTFPADFRWVGGKTEVEQMIGNAVPVALAKYVAETVRLALARLE
ncbi:MAG: DNA cytosine methyltransferase [Thermoguttaceae bacterium]|nr:DNA cytosine methyltransferase [Thermoguttaceae bacterium]